ncbi:hypothetical protein [Rhodococcus sp. AQ5-07]|uniref:hypothetical protein n=1 Tax=Rhodococcus sp. AQ5-07 TaxID=2054902 RepID=UPI0018A7CA57|nr:hypothetical protein [Rhodococcus sp. AQ5-07]
MTHDPSNLEPEPTNAASPRKPWTILEAALADIPEPQHHELTRIEHAALASRVSILALQPDPNHPQRFAYPIEIRDTLQHAALVHATLAAASTHCFPDDPNYETNQTRAMNRQASPQPRNDEKVNLSTS